MRGFLLKNATLFTDSNGKETQRKVLAEVL